MKDVLDGLTERVWVYDKLEVINGCLVVAVIQRPQDPEDPGNLERREFFVLIISAACGVQLFGTVQIIKYLCKIRHLKVFRYTIQFLLNNDHHHARHAKLTSCRCQNHLMKYLDTRRSGL